MAFIILATLAATYYALFWLRSKISLPRTIFKTLPVSLLAIAAWSSNAPILLVAALSLCALGDACLSREGERAFLAGLGSFLVAHLAYIALFLAHSTSQISEVIPGTTTIPPLTIIVWIFTSTLIVLVLFSLWSHLNGMKIPVAIYAFAIGGMNISAWSTAQQSLLLAGVTSFVISDIILAHELFVWQKPGIKLVATFAVWICYFLGQSLIIYTLIQR